MSENIDAIRLITEKLKINSVNQISLQVPMLDARFPAVNMLTVSIHHAKTKVMEYLLKHDMIDIATSCRRPLEPEQATIQSSSALGMKRSQKQSG